MRRMRQASEFARTPITTMRTEKPMRGRKAENTRILGVHLQPQTRCAASHLCGLFVRILINHEPCGRMELFTDMRVDVFSRCLCSIVPAGIRDSRSALPIPYLISLRSAPQCQILFIPLQPFSIPCHRKRQLTLSAVGKEKHPCRSRSETGSHFTEATSVILNLTKDNTIRITFLARRLSTTSRRKLYGGKLS